MGQNIGSILRKTTAPQYNMQKQNQANVIKWQRTGLLEGLESDYEKNAMSIILENQARELVLEMTKTGTQAGSEEWNGVALPLVRRIFGEIVGKEFVSIQPMTMPSGLVFYLDFKYGTGQPGFTTGSGKDSQADSVYGITETSDDPSGGIYGPGRFGYTTNDYRSVALSRNDSTPTATKYATASIAGDASNWNYNSEFYNQYSASIASGVVQKVTILSSSLANHDTVAIRAFMLSGSGIAGVFPEFTQANSDNTVISFIVSGSLAGDPNITVKYFKQPTSTTRGDFEDTVGDGTDIGIPEINLELKNKEIAAKTRKLKTIWTPEMAQDLNAYHAIDAEMELTNILSEYISQEIDLELFDMLITQAQTVEHWSARIGRRFDNAANPNTFSDIGTAEANASAYTQQTWFQTLGTKIQKVSNAIHQKTMRGGANIMACSPKVATIIESISGYNADTTGDQMNFTFGANKIGSLNGRIQVYKVPYMQENTILMAYRGNQFLETGAVYAPYIPLIMTPLVYDPTNFTPRKGVMTRYAKEMIRSEFYGKIRIGDLDTV